MIDPDRFDGLLRERFVILAHDGDLEKYNEGSRLRKRQASLTFRLASTIFGSTTSAIYTGPY